EDGPGTEAVLEGAEEAGRGDAVRAGLVLPRPPDLLVPLVDPAAEGGVGRLVAFGERVEEGADEGAAVGGDRELRGVVAAEDGGVDVDVDERAARFHPVARGRDLAEPAPDGERDVALVGDVAHELRGGGAEAGPEEE